MPILYGVQNNDLYTLTAEIISGGEVIETAETGRFPYL